TRLDPTTPAVRRLEQVGGAEFTGHMRIQKELAVGAAVVTAGGGDLPAEFVIHAVIRSDTEPVTRDGVARAWQSALERAQEWEFARLTVPPIGTGAGNLSVEDAAEVMVRVLKAHTGNASFPAGVALVVETPEARDAFEVALKLRGAAESCPAAPGRRRSSSRGPDRSGGSPGANCSAPRAPGWPTRPSRCRPEPSTTGSTSAVSRSASLPPRPTPPAAPPGRRTPWCSMSPPSACCTVP